MTTPIAHYTLLVRHGDWLVTSGQLGIVDGHLVSGGVRAEATQALANVAALLSGEGATLDDVVKATVFLRHMRDYPILNEVWSEAFGSTPPARSAVAVAELPLHALVEIEVWARAPGARD